MMNFFEQQRVSYLLPAGDKLFYGDKKLHRPQLTYREYNDWPDSTAAGNISTIWFAPNTEQLQQYPGLPGFVKSASHLKALKIPLDFLPLAEDDVPPSVFSLSIISFQNKANLEDYEKFTWNDKQVLNNVVYFSFFDFDGIYELAGITSRHLPNLSWLECFIDEDGETIEKIKAFSKLETLYAQHLRTHDIFKDLTQLPLKMLKLEGFDKGFPLQHITQLPQLEIIHINGYEEELDCTIFKQFPGLREIMFMNCKKLKNVESLLEIKSLESLHSISCNKAFGGNVKARFEQAGLQQLNIDFS